MATCINGLHTPTFLQPLESSDISFHTRPRYLVQVLIWWFLQMQIETKPLYDRVTNSTNLNVMQIAELELHPFVLSDAFISSAIEQTPRHPGKHPCHLACESSIGGKRTLALRPLVQ